MATTAQFPANAPLPVNAAGQLHDPKVEQLSQMFPDIEKEVVGLVLAHHGGDIEAAVSAMLDVGTQTPPAATPAPVDVSDADEAFARSLQDESEGDAALALRMQAEQDEAVAKAVHEELQREIKAEEDARRKELPAQAAANAQKAMSQMSSGAKALLQRLRSGPQAARGGAATSSTHGVRLLDAAADPSGGYDTAPLSIGSIRSPLQAEYAPPAAMMSAASHTPSDSHTVIAEDAAALSPRLSLGGGRASPPATTTESARSSSYEGEAPNNTNRYSSRMERARSHNRERARTLPTSSAASPTADATTAPLTLAPLTTPPPATGAVAPPAVPVVVPHVPVGELI